MNIKQIALLFLLNCTVFMIEANTLYLENISGGIIEYNLTLARKNNPQEKITKTGRLPEKTHIALISDKINNDWFTQSLTIKSSTKTLQVKYTDEAIGPKNFNFLKYMYETPQTFTIRVLSTGGIIADNEDISSSVYKTKAVPTRPTSARPKITGHGSDLPK